MRGIPETGFEIGIRKHTVDGGEDDGACTNLSREETRTKIL